LAFRHGLHPTMNASNGTKRSGGRRSELQVRMDILKVILQGHSKPTQVMYKANLSWSVVRAQARFFLGEGLIRQVKYGKRIKYEVTAKGSRSIGRTDSWSRKS